MRTLSSIVESLGDRFEFLILTHDRDASHKVSYEGIQPNAWNSLGKARVFYSTGLSFSVIHRTVREVEPDVLYLNGYWSTCSIQALALRRLGLLGDLPVVLAPRGDLAPGAMNIRRFKKVVYRSFARLFGMYDDLLWHVSSEREQAEVGHAMKSQYPDLDARTFVAPDLNSLPSYQRQRSSAKQPGIARFVCLGRIAPIKNLAYLFARLPKLSGAVTVDVYGPLENTRYWAKCAGIVRDLPDNVRVNYCGVVSHQDVQQVFAGYDFFALPTAGENFGHVIIEAASAGLPLVISDRTQWLQLRKENVGWDIPLEDSREWTTVLQTCVDMDETTYAPMSVAAVNWGAHHLSDPRSLAQNFELLIRAVAQRPSRRSSDTANVRLS